MSILDKLTTSFIPGSLQDETNNSVEGFYTNLTIARVSLQQKITRQVTTCLTQSVTKQTKLDDKIEELNRVGVVIQATTSKFKSLAERATRRAQSYDPSKIRLSNVVVEKLYSQSEIENHLVATLGVFRRLELLCIRYIR